MSIGITGLGINNFITERVGPGRGKGDGWGGTGWRPGGGYRDGGRGSANGGLACPGDQGGGSTLCHMERILPIWRGGPHFRQSIYMP